MKICPLKNQVCQIDCALYNTLRKKCNIVAYLEQRLEEKPAAAVTYPNFNTGKDSHSDYWEQLSSNRERQEPVFQPPRVEKSPW